MNNKHESRMSLVKRVLNDTNGEFIEVTVLKKRSDEFMSFSCKVLGCYKDVIKVELQGSHSIRFFSAYGVLSLRIDCHFIEFKKEDVLSMSKVVDSNQ